MRRIYILFIICFLPILTIAKEFPIDSVVNLNQFKLTEGEKDLIKKNGFVVVTDRMDQLFDLYVSNWWDSTPSFVSTDLILQLFHHFFSRTLRRIEENELFSLLTELSTKMVDKVKKAGYTDEANARIYAYFAVANKLFGNEIKLPPKIDTLCNEELKLIEEHSGRSKSAIFPFEIDYSQFIPRGNYTRSEILKEYFKLMMWYGLVPFPLEDEMLKEEDLKSLTRSVIMLTLKLVESDSLIQLWEDIYDITAFFAGKSEAYTPREYLQVLNMFRDKKEFVRFGPNGVTWDIANNEFLSKFREEVKKLPKQQIKQVAIGIPTGRQFRLFGQRFLPDNNIIENLVHYPERPFPKGLDVFSALGSGRAYKILTEVYKEQETWENYLANLDHLRNEFPKYDTTYWYQNIYYAWLYTIAALNEPIQDGYQDFMKNEAWQDKSLNTSLESWSELRHDAILYANQMYAESDVPDKMIKGYAEPNPEFYQRLGTTIELMYKKLKEKNLVSSSIDTIFQKFLETVNKLNTISGKELKRTPLPEDDLYFIWNIGERIEYLTCKIFDVEDWMAVDPQDKAIACIADVATSLDNCLEVGVGYGNTIYVMVPIEGKWTLTSGAVFSYYEFLHPVDDRLTDEKWQEMVRQGKNPPPPIWVKSFLSPNKINLVPLR